MQYSSNIIIITKNLTKYKSRKLNTIMRTIQKSLIFETLKHNAIVHLMCLILSHFQNQFKIR